MRQEKVTALCETALFTALVFLGTFLFKFPTTFGYTHLGDCMIFLAVLMLGGKRGAAAGGVGAALADLAGGYAVWIIPTLVAKGLMAGIMGAVVSGKVFGLKGRPLWLSGAILGGLCQSACYVLARMAIYGMAPALASIPRLIFQTGMGIFLAFLISEALQKTSLRGHFQFLAAERSNHA